MPDGLGVSVTESSQLLTATAMGRGGMIGSRLCKSMLVGACALTLAGAAIAQTRDFNVPEGELKAGLDAYHARQSVVHGTSVSDTVDIGVHRYATKKKHKLP